MSLFIAKLPRYGFDIQDLEDIFEKYGAITDSKLYYGKYTSYGFVDYENLDDAIDAIRNEHGRKIDGSRIVVEKARTEVKRAKGIYMDCSNCGHRMALDPR